MFSYPGPPIREMEFSPIPLPLALGSHWCCSSLCLRLSRAPALCNVSLTGVCVCVCVCAHMLVSQLCRLFGTSYLLYPWNSPGKNTELGAISSWLRDQILVSHIVGRFFTVWATREAQECVYMCKHLMWTTNSLEKTLMLGTTGGRRRRGWQSMWWLIAIINSMDVSLSKFQEIVKDRETWCAESMGSQRVRHSWAMEQQQ